MKNYIIASIILLITSSCFTERIDLDLNSNNEKLVITGWITDLDEPQYITLSLTTNYLGDQPVNYVSDAEVTLSDETSSYSLTENEAGVYYLPDDWSASVGDLYTLEVRYNDELYTASHLMRPCPEIEDYTYELYEFGNFEDELEGDWYETIFAIQEMPGEGDGYFAIDYTKGTLSGDSLVNGNYFDDEFIDGWFLDDLRVTDSERLYSAGDSVVIELYSVGLNTTTYFNDIESEVFRGGPFDPPPTNVGTNISNGGVGYFIVSSARTEVLLIE